MRLLEAGQVVLLPGAAAEAVYVADPRAPARLVGLLRRVMRSVTREASA